MKREERVKKIYQHGKDIKEKRKQRAFHYKKFQELKKELKLLDKELMYHILNLNKK